MDNLVVLSLRMQSHLKTYATRLARKHVLQRMGLPGVEVLETEKQLLEMALSRLREELICVENRIEESEIATLIRREAAVVVGRFTEDDAVREATLNVVASLSDEEVLPQIH